MIIKVRDDYEGEGWWWRWKTIMKVEDDEGGRWWWWWWALKTFNRAAREALLTAQLRALAGEGLKLSMSNSESGSQRSFAREAKSFNANRIFYRFRSRVVNTGFPSEDTSDEEEDEVRGKMRRWLIGQPKSDTLLDQWRFFEAGMSLTFSHFQSQMFLRCP